MYCLRNLCVSCSIICSLLFNAKTMYVWVTVCVIVYRYKCNTFPPEHMCIRIRTGPNDLLGYSFPGGFSYSVFISALISAVNIIHIVRRENNWRSRNSIVFFICCCLFTISFSVPFSRLSFLHINFWYCSAHCGLANGTTFADGLFYSYIWKLFFFLLFVNISERWTGSSSMCVRIILCNIWFPQCSVVDE